MGINDLPDWARPCDIKCVAWPKYLAATVGPEPRTLREWLMYREGYGQGLRDALDGEAVYPPYTDVWEQYP